MKFMLLIYNNPAQEPKYGTKPFEDMMNGFFAASERMRNDKVLCDGEVVFEASDIRVGLFKS